MNLNDEMDSGSNHDAGHESLGFTNFIINQPSANEKEVKDHINTAQPTLHTITNPHLGTRRVLTNDLSKYIKSKEDLYTILGIEGQFHLPPFDECTMEFLRDALRGIKKLLANTDVR